MTAPLVGGGTTRVGLTGPRHQFRRDYMYDDGSAAASTTPSGGGGGGGSGATTATTARLLGRTRYQGYNR